jgi:VanZ family protein
MPRLGNRSASRRPGRSDGDLNSGSEFVLLLLFRTVGWASVVAVVVVSLVPGDARPDTGLPGQIDHIIAYCGTAGLLGLGYPTAKSRFGMIVMLISLAATLEVAQRWIPGRHPQFIDFAASVAGTCLGMLAAMVVHRIALGDLR